MKRAPRRLVPIASVCFVVCLAGAWWTRRSWAAGLLVMTPSADGVPALAPLDVRETVEVARKGAVVRAWVFEPTGPARGTVLMLHGIRDNKLNLVSGARGHTARGYCAVAVDSRGHGESSGRYLTYGVEESLDLVAAVDELERRKLLVKPLAVVGASYGAVTALLYAAIDSRVDKVVALAPFASLRVVVPAYLKWVFGWPARWIPSAVVNELIDGAARQAGFDADQACPRCVAPRIRASVLLIHSRDDERIPWQQSVEIRNALKSPTKLMLVDGVKHVDTGDGAGVPEMIERWLDAT